MYRRAYGSTNWLGPKVGSHLALLCIHCANWVNSQDNSTITRPSMTEKFISRIQESAHITLPLTLTTPWMQAYLVTIVCKFGGDPTISVGEEAICAKVYRRTDRQTTDAAPLHKLILGMS